jgi:hypothetical protein
MMINVEQSVELLAEETEDDLPQCRFIHHKLHMT